MNHTLTDRTRAHALLRMIFDDDISQNRAELFRGFVTWRARDHLTLGAGYDYHSRHDRPNENRIWQQIEHRSPIGRLTLRNRLRLDTRFIGDVGGAVWRLRYRLRGEHPIAHTGWSGILSNEVFTNLNNRGEGPTPGFDQNRARVALATRLHPNLRLEAGYEWHYADRRDRTALRRHVIVLEFSIDTGHANRSK